MDNNEYVENIQIEGRQAVLEALEVKRPIDRILIKKGKISGNINDILDLAAANGVMYQLVPKERLDTLAQGKNHQGVIALCPQQAYVSVDDILEAAAEKNEDAFILLLDSIMDPHNLGAIIRSAECAGVHGVIIPKRRAVGLTGVVARVSSGALEHMKVAQVTNLNQTIEYLKEKGLWIFCADMGGETVFKQNMTGPIGVVIGGEGNGVSQKIKENCDHVVSIPTKGHVDSLNASVAAGVVLYEVVRQREGM